MGPTTLFVYGTLKTGQPNHHYLAGQHLVRTARTLPCYRLYTCGSHPALKEAGEGGVAVEGELWQVDERALAELDRFEGTMFERRPITVDGCPAAVAYFYLGDLRQCRECGTSWPP